MGPSPHTPVLVSLGIKYIEGFFIFTGNWAGKKYVRLITSNEYFDHDKNSEL